MKLLLISNSTNPGEPYLDYPKNHIKQFLGDSPTTSLFIPFAAVTFSYDEYEQKVQNRFHEIGHNIKSIHHFNDMQQALENAQCIVVGGGNTWKLVQTLRKHNLLNCISKKVKQGTPYIGWSAGSNIACPTLKTTNDMPIVDPQGFDTLNLVPFQINPHYLDVHPSNFGGETREMRINEFTTENKNTYVVGLRESTMLLVQNNTIRLIGGRSARIFKYGKEKLELTDNDSFNFLLEANHE